MTEQSISRKYHTYQELAINSQTHIDTGNQITTYCSTTDFCSICQMHFLNNSTPNSSHGPPEFIAFGCTVQKPTQHNKNSEGYINVICVAFKCYIALSYCVLEKHEAIISPQ